MRRIFASLTFFTVLTASASAFPIAYTESGNGNGFFAGKSFSSSQITLTFSADSDSIDDWDTEFHNFTGTARVAVAGIGEATFAGVNVYANHNNNPAAVGFADVSGRTIIGTLDNLFSTYELDTVGPITSTASFTRNLAFTTSAGDFVISSLSNTTFSASEIVSTVPLPASFPLFATALLGLAAIAYGRRGSMPERLEQG